MCLWEDVPPICLPDCKKNCCASSSVSCLRCFSDGSTSSLLELNLHSNLFGRTLLQKLMFGCLPTQLQKMLSTQNHTHTHRKTNKKAFSCSWSVLWFSQFLQSCAAFPLSSDTIPAPSGLISNPKRDVCYFDKTAERNHKENGQMLRILARFLPPKPAKLGCVWVQALVLNTNSSMNNEGISQEIFFCRLEAFCGVPIMLALLQLTQLDFHGKCSSFGRGAYVSKTLCTAVPHPLWEPNLCMFNGSKCQTYQECSRVAASQICRKSASAKKALSLVQPYFHSVHAKYWIWHDISPLRDL